MKIPIFTDDPGWHGNQLKKAFKENGVDTEFVSLRNCLINLSAKTPQIQIPGFKVLPLAVFVRGVSGGTLQQVTMRLNVLHMLAFQNVKIYNDVKAIERTVDKAMTSFLLRNHSISTPATWVCESRQQAEEFRQMAEYQNKKLVIKPLFGSQGLGVSKLDPRDPLPVPMQQHLDGVYYIQEFIEAAEAPHDFRVFVINYKVVAAMKRTGNSWISNVAAGGRCEAVEPNEVMTELALQAAYALNINYCGVDIIQDTNGNYLVLEVNSIPAWKGLQGVIDLNIADLLVQDFICKI